MTQGASREEPPGDPLAGLIALVPELGARLVELAGVHEDALDLHVACTELADLVSASVAEGGDAALIARCCDAAEQLASAGEATGRASRLSGPGTNATEVDSNAARRTTPGTNAVDAVGYCFLDRLSPEVLAALCPLLGPETFRVLAHLDAGELCWE